MTRLRRLLAALALAATVLGVSAQPARADICFPLRSPSTGIHMRYLWTVNGGSWGTVFGSPGARFVQYVPAYGLWVEVWIGNQLWVFPEYDIDVNDPSAC